MAKKPEKRKPKIGYFDIETSPILGWTWSYWEGEILKVEQDVKIIAFSWLWEGEKHAKVYALPDFPGYKADSFNIDDSKIAKKLWEFLDEADVVIAQNGDKFDIRRSNTSFLVHGMKPPRDYIPIDTLKIARKYFSFTSNSLGQIMRQVGLPGKLSTGGKELWFACMAGDPKAWAKMKRYCKNDTELLPPLYKLMRGWHKTHPNLAFFYRGDLRCKACGSEDYCEKEMTKYLRSAKRQGYTCNICGHNFYGDALKDGMEKVTVY